MKTPSLNLCALFACFVMLTACSQAPGLSRLQYAPSVDPNHKSSPLSFSYISLYSFGADPDGREPAAGVFHRGDHPIYGTTVYGGAHGEGTVFSYFGGTDTVLHSFNGIDGARPGAGLIDVSGTLYGTTRSGGRGNCVGGCGVVFSIKADGTVKVLHDFGVDTSDGTHPEANLIDVSGTLYGTTLEGGGRDRGTAFSITTDGTERVLHSFGYYEDGYWPMAPLIDVSGTLYGTTYAGGAGRVGTVFSMTTDGTEKVLHGFSNGQDGKYPRAPLINVNGKLYGTTESGGAFRAGTVFDVSTDGHETVLHSFGDGYDGVHPEAGLRDMNGTLYGTTADGGAYVSSYNFDGFGTVFSITPDGHETVLHSFGNGDDGAHPAAGLRDVSGMGLVGTTRYGGVYGRGTVFEL
jgi:uncharacterized repeat protein (TIGR03803 family)